MAARLLREGGDPADAALAAAIARSLRDADLDAPDLRDERVGSAASIVSAMPAVREALLDYQRDFGRRPPGAVIDGRDIGTVVCPDATHKLFVTASAEARAERRYRELVARRVATPREAVLRELVERDARDTTRAVAPLAPAADAIVLDTTDMDAEAAFAAALKAIGEAPPERGASKGPPARHARPRARPRGARRCPRRESGRENALRIPSDR